MAYSSAMYRWHFVYPDIVLVQDGNSPELVTLDSLGAALGETAVSLKAIIENFSVTIGAEVPAGKSLAKQWLTVDVASGAVTGAQDCCTLADAWRVLEVTEAL
jgi:hypothetical protein